MSSRRRTGARLVGAGVLAATGVACVVCASVIKNGSLRDPLGAAGLPVAAGLLLAAIAIAIAIRDGISKSETERETEFEHQQETGPFHWWRPAALVVGGLGWVVLIGQLGYLVATAIALMVFFLAAGVRVAAGGIAAVSGSLLTFAIFVVALGIHVPSGPLDIALAEFARWGASQ